MTGVGGSYVTVGYISVVILAWFPMEKMHSGLCCVTVGLSLMQKNFEPVGPLTVGWRSQMCYSPACLVKRKEQRRVRPLHDGKGMG